MTDETARSAFRASVDPATFEVVKNSLYSAAEEMKIVLAKTAYSPLLKVAGDYSCGIFDAAGEMVAQGPDLPIHLGSMPDSVKAVRQAWPEPGPGDVFIHNDPYFGGSHLPDVNVVMPAFDEAGELLGFACVRAHWPDIGGATPGSYGAATDIYGEGLRLPPVRLFIAGEINPDVDALIFANVRTPEERRGDLRAQVAANRRGAERLSVLARKHGSASLRRIMADIMDYSEVMMRRAIAELADGEGAFEELMDGDGVADDEDGNDAPIRVKIRVVKRGPELLVDFAGSDPQSPGPMNAPLAVTASGVFTSVKMLADPGNVIPPNSGCWRPITVLAPPGSVMHATLPAPVVYANHEVGHRAADMFFAAMAQIAPQSVMACSQGTSAILTLGGIDYRNGRAYVSYETLKGGFGARPTKDGINGLASGIANTMNTPVEVLEMSFPVRVEAYELIPDSGGAGRWRGGLGTRRVTRVLGSDASASVCCERTLAAPFGLEGGHDGAPAEIVLVDPNGGHSALASKGPFKAIAGSKVIYSAPGSGGWGPPGMRDRDALRADLRDGYVTPAGARAAYGVDPETLAGGVED